MGSEDDAETELLSFLRTAVSSVCALELLILLRRSPGSEWRREDLVRELRSSDLAVAQALEHLSRSGLVIASHESGVRYQQYSAQLDAICERLEQQYAEKPVTVISAILETPNEKLRVFADAFRLLGKPK